MLVANGYGVAPVLGAASLALLLCVGLGLRATKRVIQFQRGEVARVYASAREAPRRAAFERRDTAPTGLESLKLAMVDLVQNLRRTVLCRDHVRLWAVSIRRALDERSETTRALAAMLGEDAHTIAAAAITARREEAEIGATVNALFKQVGFTAEATCSIADETESLKVSVHQITVQFRQAAAMVASLADTAMTAQRGVALVDAGMKDMLHAAEQVKAVLQRAEMVALNACVEAAHAGEAGRGFAFLAAEVKSLATSGRAALDTMLQTVRDLKGDAMAMSQTVAAVGDSMQAQGALRQALGEAMSRQTEAVARIVGKASKVNKQIVALQQHASSLERRELGFSSGAAARRAVERLPTHADAIVTLLQDLPAFKVAS